MCRRTVLGAALLALACVVLPGLAADDKPAGKKKDDGMVTMRPVTGRIVSVEESKRGLRVNLYGQIQNPVAKESYTQAMKALRKARSKDERTIARQQAEAAYKDLSSPEIDLVATEDVVIRVAQPPAVFDEKGKIKKYTKKELKDLKGDAKLPGYSGEFANLRQNQVVQITLIKKKEAASGKKARDADAAMAADNLPLIKMVIVLRDPGN